jgi:hypothetical protein
MIVVDYAIARPSLCRFFVYDIDGERKVGTARSLMIKRSR